jgi:hypothetical protein
MKWYSVVLGIQSFMSADCNTDRPQVVVIFTERLMAGKETLHRFHVERFRIKKLYEINCREQYCIDLANRSVAVENLDVDVDGNRA